MSDRDIIDDESRTSVSPRVRSQANCDVREGFAAYIPLYVPQWVERIAYKDSFGDKTFPRSSGIPSPLQIITIFQGLTSRKHRTRNIILRIIAHGTPSCYSTRSNLASCDDQRRNPDSRQSMLKSRKQEHLQWVSTSMPLQFSLRFST